MSSERFDGFDTLYTALAVQREVLEVPIIESCQDERRPLKNLARNKILRASHLQPMSSPYGPQRDVAVCIMAEARRTRHFLIMCKSTDRTSKAILRNERAGRFTSLTADGRNDSVP